MYRRNGFTPILILLLIGVAVGILFIPIPYYEKEDRWCESYPPQLCSARGWHLGPSLWQRFSGQLERPVSSSVQPSSTLDETANWETYEDNALGFTIKYPPTWWAKKSKEGIVIISKPPEPSEIPPLTHGLWDGLTISGDHVPWDKTVLDKKINSDQDIKSEPTNFVDQPGSKLVVSLEDGSSFNRIIFNTNGKGWTIDFPNNADGNVDPIYNQILSTFKFTD